MQKVDLLCRSAKMDNTQFNELNPQSTTDGIDKPPVEIAVCINSEHKKVYWTTALPVVFYSYFQCISIAMFALCLCKSLHCKQYAPTVSPRNCYFPAVFACAPALTLKHTCPYSRVRAWSMAWKQAYKYKCTYKLKYKLGEVWKANQNNLSMKSDSCNVCDTSNFGEKFWCCLDTKGISMFCRLTRFGWSKFGLSSACQPRIPFDGKYVYWAYPSRMASLAGAVNDQWDSPMLGSFRLKGIWKSICSRIWNLLSKVAVSSVCIEAKGKREGERGTGERSLAGSLYAGECQRQHQVSTEEGEFSSACAITHNSFPLPLPSRRHFSFIVVGKPTKQPTWHDIAWRIPPTTISSFALHCSFPVIWFIF